MSLKGHTFLVLLVPMWLMTSSVADVCVKLGPCSCQSDKGVIDLSPLAGSGSPKFQDVLDQQFFYKFSWNPCNPFTEGTGCSSVAACQVTQDLSTQYPVGTQDSAKFVTDGSDNVMIEYSSTDGTGVTRTSQVTLICDTTSTTDKFVVMGEVSTANYAMTLTSRHCCPGAPIKKKSGSLSAGSILLIAFVCLLVVYLVAGMAFQKGARKATGKEIIPNYGLWSSLPGLMKDGVKFTVTCGKGSPSYDKI